VTLSARARVYKTDGVIIRRRNLGEADSIFTVFSGDQGKFDAIARGVRKARSHMRGHLEPLTRSSLMLAHGRTLDVFTQAQTIHAYRAVREDLDRTASALYCAELVDQISAERVPNPELFALFVSILDALEGSAPAHVVQYFELRLLAASGYEIQLDRCAVCDGRLAEEETVLSPAAGGLVCRGCRPAAGQGRIISVRGIKVLRFARGATLEAFAGLRMDAGLAREVQAALSSVVVHTLERELNTERHLADVARLPARD